MNSKERLLKALNREVPDRLPATTHHVLPYFLNTYMNGCSRDEFFEEMKLDPITWVDHFRLENESTEYYKDGFAQSKNWKVIADESFVNGYETTKYKIITPKKVLTTVIQKNKYTSWTSEHLIKEKSDIELIEAYAPTMLCDIDKLNKEAATYGNTNLIRGTIPVFPFRGQPGCWQDISCLFGIEKLIYETFDDPKWVHEFLHIILKRKLKYVESLQGANYDLIELGGGDASTTVISPTMFNDFVLPYDKQIITKAHEVKQKIVYHTCGGMMPILEDLVSMKADALETFTPVGMGGDVDLKEAKRRIGDKVCMIGGLDQGLYFSKSSENETRKAVRKYFDEAGEGGGFILSPSDHFFDADPRLIKVFSDEASKCLY